MKSMGKFDERIVEALIEEKLSFNEKMILIRLTLVALRIYSVMS